MPHLQHIDGRGPAGISRPFTLIATEKPAMPLELYKAVPNFSAISTAGEFNLAAFKGKKLVLYFYPKDNTPGCTSEATDFRDAHKALTDANAVVVGVSRDSIKSHMNFKAKFELNFDLLADQDEAVCHLFEVMKMKSMYGKQVRGIERSTFIIDANSQLVSQMRGVKVAGHVTQVLSIIQAL
jgi:thioredoxin-dependent peroxiredoxin